MPRGRVGVPPVTTRPFNCTMLRVAEAPAWLSYASPAIALVALLVATASVLLARATYRRAGPDVRARYWVALNSEELPAARAPLVVIITARNRGLASVDVERLILQRGDFSGKHFQWRFYVDETGELEDGPKLPVRLEAGTKRTWVYGLREINLNRKTATESSEMDSALRHAQLIIELGDGREAIFRPGLRAYLWYIDEWIERERRT